METKKSFVGLENAYSFFKTHSSQLGRAMEAITPLVDGQKHPRGEFRACFLGCADLELALHLVRHLAEKHAIHVTLVDTHRQWLRDGVRHIGPHSGQEVQALTSLAEASSPFDLIVAHHSLYYVPDLSSTLRSMHTLLSPDGRLMIALASPSNKLKQCAIDLFRLRGQALPYWLLHDLEAALTKVGFRWESLSVPSAVSCADGPSSRTALINFLMGNLDVPNQEALDVFTPYRDGVRLHIPMDDTWLVCRPT